MDKSTEKKDLPKLKTQLPDPLLSINFSNDDLGRILIDIRYASNIPGAGMLVYRGIVLEPESLQVGLKAAIEGARG